MVVSWSRQPGLFHGIRQWPCLHYITALDLTRAVITQGPLHIFSVCGCSSSLSAAVRAAETTGGPVFQATVRLELPVQVRRSIVKDDSCVEIVSRRRVKVRGKERGKRTFAANGEIQSS